MESSKGQDRQTLLARERYRRLYAIHSGADMGTKPVLAGSGSLMQRLSVPKDRLGMLTPPLRRSGLRRRRKIVPHVP